MVAKRYGYKKSYKAIKLMTVIISVAMFIVGFYFLYLAFSNLLSPNQYDLSTVLNNLWLFFGYSVWAPFFFIYSSQVINEISVDDDGLQVMFLWKAYRINWGNIQGVNTYRFLGIKPFVSRNTKVVTVKAGLTPFHRLYGLLNARVNRPAFVIDESMVGFTELINEINLHLQKDVSTPKSKKGNEISRKVGKKPLRK